MGGVTTGNVATSSVEVLSWGQPKATLILNPGFYVATATESTASDDGFWGLQATFPESTNGGMFFGGLLAGQGRNVAFASFSIAANQLVTVQANLFPLPGTQGNLDVTLRVLDANKNPVAPSTPGTGSVTWSGALAAGTYVVELRSGPNAPAAAVNASVSALNLQGSISAGGSLRWSAGVTGYLAFATAAQQQATFQVSNEQSYGIGTGAGSVILTVQDASGNILKKLAPGGIDLTSTP